MWPVRSSTQEQGEKYTQRHTHLLRVRTVFTPGVFIRGFRCISIYLFIFVQKDMVKSHFLYIQSEQKLRVQVHPAVEPVV